MKTFDYIRPNSISDAIAAAAEPGAAYLAAGTNLLDLMKGGVSRPDRLVDVTRLPGLDRIEPLPDGGARKCQRDTRCEIQADQDSDISDANPEFAAQQRRDRGHALKLECHGGANRKQNGKYAPAIAHASLSRQVVGAAWDRATSLSIVADICCDHAEIGIVARFT